MLSHAADHPIRETSYLIDPVDRLWDLPSLLAAIRAGRAPTYLHFWGHKAPERGAPGNHFLSQWWPAPFSVDDVRYATAEHFMMAEKARLFGDAENRARILDARSPSAAKRIGREVRGFDDERWSGARVEAVVRGNRAKLTQNPELRDFLMGAGTEVFVEASPKDRIWGIGLRESDPRASDPTRWRGLNLLGFALTRVRDELR